MELREPPRHTPSAAPDRLMRWLLLVNLILLVGILALLVLRPGAAVADHQTADLGREVAAKLKAAGALEEAAALYEQYLQAADAPPETRAKIAYSVATTYLHEGAWERALRWLYEAETIGAGELSNEVSKKIVYCLERLGRHHVAQAALDERVQLADDQAPVKRPADDPVVARIGDEEIYRSEVLRALDDLPPEMTQSMSTAEQRQELLKQFVAQELLWRKASKLEYDQDPEVQRRYASALKKLAVSRFLEKEVVGKIEVDDADLHTYFEANKDRYKKQESKDKPAREPSFEEVRPAVERDYRMYKIQAAYQEIINSELATADVELHPERLQDDA